MNEIIHGNFLDNTLPDKCANLIIADPPYFEIKGDFDFVWESFEDYLRDVEKWAAECKRILADNGTLFWWGHAKKIAYSQIILDRFFNLENSMVWEKVDSMQYQYYSPDLARCFNTHNERLLMYSSEWDKTGLETIHATGDCFESIKAYMDTQYRLANLTHKKVNVLLGTASNGGGLSVHYFGFTHNPSKTQFQIPTQEHYKRLQHATGLFCKEYEELRKEYEELRKEYEELRRPFNNYLKLTDVLRYSQESNVSRHLDHDTVKPEKLTSHLILTCSRPGDLVVAPFAGSGTECAMAAKENRKFMGYDIEEKHVNTARKRCEKILKAPPLFHWEPESKTA